MLEHKIIYILNYNFFSLKLNFKYKIAILYTDYLCNLNVVLQSGLWQDPVKMKFTCYETLRRWLPLYYVHILNDKLSKNIHKFNIIQSFFPGYSRLYFFVLILNSVQKHFVMVFFFFLLKVCQLIIDTSISLFYLQKGKRKPKTLKKFKNVYCFIMQYIINYSYKNYIE